MVFSYIGHSGIESFRALVAVGVFRTFLAFIFAHDIGVV